jgi:hypothetical protein
MNTHEFDRTVLGLRMTFLRVLASVKSMTKSHRLYRAVNWVNFGNQGASSLAVKVSVPTELEIIRVRGLALHVPTLLTSPKTDIHFVH